MKQLAGIRKILIVLKTLVLSVIFGTAASAANGTLLRNDTGLYPRA